MNSASYRATSAYGRAQKCVPQPWMVVVLLKGVLDHLEGARRAFANSRRAEMLERASKAMAILQGLRDNLRPEISERFTSRLDEFYGSTILHIAQLTRSGFPEGACTRVMTDVKLVHDAWSALDDKGGGED